MVIAGLLIGIALRRSGRLQQEIYVSQSFLYHSVTVLISGVYLFAVGLLAGFLGPFNGGSALAVKAFWVFLASLGLAVLLLSERLRLQIKRFVGRHFRRPLYDYRKEWMDFTRRTQSIVDISELGVAVAKKFAETFNVLAVNIWLADEKGGRPFLAGSTVFSKGGEKAGGGYEEALQALTTVLQDCRMPVDSADDGIDWMKSITERYAEFFLRGGIRWCVPLRSGGEFVGFVALGDRALEGGLSVEELELVQTVADQAAAGFRNLRLAEQLSQAREMEAFQAMSAFFVHDLKNLASTLSLTMQNLPQHYDDPHFRRDALRTIEKSVERINEICCRLTPLRREVRLQSALTDLNTLVSQALETLNGALQSSVATGLAPVPEISVDREQMQKVLVNLILNAQEACGGGEIRISTGIDENRAMIAVRDNGCGMSGDFMERSLFLPFQTTKKRGLGIGLFHCKQIVDAHGGQIEVESVEGKGSTFRVMLPIGESQRAVSKRERHSDQRRGRRSEKYGRTQTYPSLKRPVWTGIKMKGL